MSRSLVLGNGTLLLCFDHFGLLRDFYYPYAGLENHISSGDAHKIGFFIDGHFTWITDGEWQVSTDYEKSTMVSAIVARNESRGIEVLFTDIVYDEKNILVRKVTVKNHLTHAREVKVFFNQEFQISQTTHADTAYYNPSIEALIHYKGRRVFLIAAEVDGKRFTEYSVGIFKIEGKEGTWRDAEDGHLSENPIEHGSVDSTLALTMNVPAEGEVVGYYWITVAETFREASDLQDYLLEKTPEHAVNTTRDFWKAWLQKNEFDFEDLSSETISLFEKSLCIIRTHCDNGGGILASGDSDNFRYGRDTYAYVWPRDGAFVAMALDSAGYSEISRRFYDFSNQIITEDGYMLHKYQPDKSLGSSWHPWIRKGRGQLPIQEDETALLLVGLWEHYEKVKDLEFIESIYNSLIKRAANFILSYRDGFNTGLPYESYDLWEERRGVATFTAASVAAALIAAGKFAHLLGKEKEEALYDSEARKIHDAIVSLLWNKEHNYFYKLLTISTEPVAGELGNHERDASIDSSSFFGVFRFGVLPIDDPRLKEAREVARTLLSKPIPKGGYARYQGDMYYEVTPDVPGNPWFITLLWMMQYDIAVAKKKSELKAVAEDFAWVAAHAQKSGILSEQVHPLTGDQLSVAPLTWSHAEFVATVVAYTEKMKALK